MDIPTVYSSSYHQWAFGLFPVEAAITNKEAVSISVQVYERTQAFMSRMAGSHGRYTLTLAETAKLLSRVVVPFHVPKSSMYVTVPDTSSP